MEPQLYPCLVYSVISLSWPLLQAPFKYVDDLASVWCEWCEMELRHKNFKRALEIMRRATAAPVRPRKREVRAHAAGGPAQLG